MIKIFIPLEKGKNKSAVRGLWRSDTGKVYYDYLKEFNLNKEFNRQRNKLIIKKLNACRAFYNQEALFFTDNNHGYILNKDLTYSELLKKIVYDIGFNRHNLKGILKRTLRDYKGLTIYQTAEGYRIEAYYNE